MSTSLIVAFGSILLAFIAGMFWWWRLGVQEERERQDSASEATR